MKTLIQTFILLTLSISIQANADLTQNIRGKVIDLESGYPLIGANVILLGSNPVLGTVTDLNGEFALEDIPVGRHNLEISYVGYNARRVSNLLLTSGKELVLEIELEENAFAMDEVVVKAFKNKSESLNEMASISARTFSVEETERFAGSLGDPARMVANYAGVNTQSDARNDIIIRGNSPIGVLWRLEGIEIPNPNHFGALGTTGGPVSMLNNNLLSNSDFMTGAFPAEYGNATSGVFDLNMRSGNNRKTEFTGQIGFNGFEGGIEGPMFNSGSGQKASYLVNYRYSTLDLVNKIGLNAGTGTATPEFQDASYIIDIPGTRIGRFKIIGLWGISDINIEPDTVNNLYGTPGMITKFGSAVNMIGATHTYFFTEKVSMNSTISYQRIRSTTKIDSLKYATQLRTPIIRNLQQENKLSVSTRLNYKINKRNNASIGLIYDQIAADFNDSIRLPEYNNEFVTSTDVDETVSLIRGFAQHQYKINKSLTAYGGVYFQYFDLNKETAVEPRLGLNAKLGNKSTLSFGFGMHSQIQPRVVYFHQDSTGVERTNLDVKFTRSNHYIVGYDYSINENFRIKAETYYQNLYNVPVKEDFVEFSMINAGAFFAIPREDNLVNEGKGRNYGVELTVEKFLSDGYYFLFTTSIFNSEYTDYNGNWKSTAFNGNYVFNLLGGYERKLSEMLRLTFDVKTVLAGGRRYIPIDYDESFRQQEEIRIWDNAYKDKYPDYFRVDLRIGVKMNMKRFSQEWGVDLQNLTNHQSLFMEGVDLENGSRYSVNQQEFLPMVLYRIQF
jgi:hypothetical protein